VPPSDEPHAVLLVLHDDVLLPGQLEETVSVEADEGSAIPSTRQKPEYPLTEEECVIGRDPECTIRFKKHRMDTSRRHAVIKREGSVFMLYDRSTNGTFVNRERIYEGYQLHDDDVIGFADMEKMLRFRDFAHPAQAVSLTNREREVLCEMAAGRQYKEIAAKLNISQNTVKDHIKHIYNKLGVDNRVEAVERARILALLKPRSAR